MLVRETCICDIGEGTGEGGDHSTRSETEERRRRYFDTEAANDSGEEFLSEHRQVTQQRLAAAEKGLAEVNKRITEATTQ